MIDAGKAYLLIVAIISSSLLAINADSPGRDASRRDAVSGTASLSAAAPASRHPLAKLFDRGAKPREKHSGKTKSIEKPKRDIINCSRTAGSARFGESTPGLFNSFRLFTPATPKSQALPVVNGEYFSMILALLPNPRSPPVLRDAA